MGPTWPFLLTYGSHDMRQFFHRLTVVNGTPRNWGITKIWTVGKTFFFYVDIPCMKCEESCRILKIIYHVTPQNRGVSLTTVNPQKSTCLTS